MKKKHRIGIQVILVFVLLVGGYGVSRYLGSQRPTLEKEVPLPVAPMARVETVVFGDHTINVRGEGTVTPLREIRVVPEVSGKVVRISEKMKDGGTFDGGETMLRIDPRDYEVAVALSRARLADARAVLKKIQEESGAAVEEWLAHSPPDSNQETPPLVARIPQLEAAGAQVDALEADLDRALLNLERTRITAPFAGIVSDKAVDLGQFVSPGQALAVFFDVRAVEIVVPLEDEHLAWISVPGFTQAAGRGSPAVVSATVAGRDMSWTGRVTGVKARLDPRTRMVPVVVRVDDPYAQMPPAAVGLFVRVEIQGRILENVAIVPRAALRQDNLIWKVDAGERLRFVTVRVARVDEQGVIVSSGLDRGDRVVVSLLDGVSDGMLVRTVSNNTGVRQPGRPVE